MDRLMFGSICVWLALLGAITSAVLYGLVQKGHEKLRPWARLSYVMVAQGIIWAAFHMMFLVLHHRYEVNYVAEYSSNDLPTASVFGLQIPFFLMSSFWGGQQGTFFLWAIYGSILGVLLMTRCRKIFEAPAMLVLSVIEGFLALLLALSGWPSMAGPFVLAKAGQIPADGQGLNVLLQNHWMVIHPPIMFLGFSSLSIPFALGVAALVSREYDEWINVAWPWVLFAWCALGAGLFMGGYWAYTVLGWGGFWAWDNVENSSFIPWLATTALIHGMLLQRARGSMKRANLLFALTPYVMVLFGSFLTRSGILSDFSVHSFAAPARIIYVLLLAFVGTFFAGSCAVLIWRIRSVPKVDAFEHERSRGFFFIIGAWAIYISSWLVLYGTSHPLITGLHGKPSNVNQAWYDQKLFPVGILLLLMMGITPFLKWRGKPTEGLGRILGISLAGAVILGLLLTVANARFYGESLRAPAEAIVRTNPSLYSAPTSPRPSGVLLNGRTSAAGAVTPAGGNQVTVGGQVFSVPSAPHSFSEAYVGALGIRFGYAYPIFAIAALFCILANGLMIFRITGGVKRSWLPAGGYLTHVGVGVLLIGVVTVLNYGGDATINLDPGEQQAPSGHSIDFKGGTPVSAFGHTFTFQGFDVIQKGSTAVMKIAVQTGDETIIARPRLTIARDGNMVHFPSIRKYWTEDLYVSPIKLPGMGGDQNQEFKFHVILQVTRDGRTSTISPGVTFAASGGMRPTDTPLLPGSNEQVVLQSLQTPTRDAPNLPAVLDLAMIREGAFQKRKDNPVLHLRQGSTAEYKGYTLKFVKFSVDKETEEQVKASQQEAHMAQVEISTKPMVNLVWLGTFLVIGGGILAARRRTLEARSRSRRQTEE